MFLYVMLAYVPHAVHAADGVRDGRRTGRRDCRYRVPFEGVPARGPK